MILSRLTFERQLSRFATLVRDNSGNDFRSFAHGLPAEWEDYKGAVRGEALRLLDTPKWREASIGSGVILKRVVKAIEIDGPGGLRNNLVAWQNRYGHKGRSHRALLDATTDVATRRELEAWLYEFFRDLLPAPDAFESLRKLAGDRYDLIAYLFFLKDWTRYMPIAPTTFDEAFRHLGIPVSTTRQCSWDNYRQYNDALMAVLEALRDVPKNEDARLLDAHSFCWMLVRLEPPDAEPLPEIRAPRTLAVDTSRGGPQKSAVPADASGAVSEDMFVERDAERRRMGRIAQDVAFESEKTRLREAGHPNPAGAVRPVWNEPALGYDIESQELDGTARPIEVKSARYSNGSLMFFISDNEARKSRELPNYHLYLVLDADSPERDVVQIRGRDLVDAHLAPVTYRACVPVLS